MIGIHKCGQGWVYCDGNCATCAVNYCTTTTSTNAQVTIKKDYPPCLDHPKERKKQTNADRIRAMTDEELDRFLGEVQWDVANYCGDVIQKMKYPLPKQRGAWLDWLKKEAEEGE